MTASASSAMKAARPASLRRLLGCRGGAGVCFAGAGVCLARGSDRFSVVAGKGFGPQGAFLREIFPRNPAANRLRSGPIMAVRSSWSVAGRDACLKAITGKIHTDRTAHFREPCRARAGNAYRLKKSEEPRLQLFAFSTSRPLLRISSVFCVGVWNPSSLASETVTVGITALS